jgi:hypothetical protein
MKRVLCFALATPFIFLVFLATSSQVFAQSQDAVGQQSRIEQAAAQPKANQEKFTYNSVLFTMSGLLKTMQGCVTEACRQSAEISDAGAVQGVSRMIAFTFNQPASVDTYIADVMQNMRIAQPAYAQGIGFSALQPVLGLWKLFRNIAYLFFVFIFLIIGFAIMFRQSLGGQTAVTIQQALPRIIVALLAVSFSYAIAGLMVDLMWIVMYFLITMFQSQGLIDAPSLSGYSILNKNIFQVFIEVINNGFASNAGTVIGDFVTTMLSGAGSVNDALASGAGWLAGILGSLILFFAIIFAMFRTFFGLIKVYFEIILSIIFAPVILMMGAINGNAFGNWLKSLVANLAVFPVLLVFILIGYMLVNFDTGNSLPQQLQSSGFIPPFVPGRSTANDIGLVGGIAAIMLLPEVISIVGKYKPASIFQELGGTAWKNAMSGKGPGQAIFGVGAGLAGAGLVGGGAGLVAAARAQNGGRMAAFKNAGLGAGKFVAMGGALAGGAGYAKNVIGTVGKYGKDIREVQQQIDAARTGWANQRERNVPADPNTLSTNADEALDQRLAQGAMTPRTVIDPKKAPGVARPDSPTDTDQEL